MNGSIPLVAVLVLIGPASPARAVEPTPVTVDLLVYYTPGVTARYGSGVDTRLNHVVNIANDAYQRSEAGLRVRIVHSEEIAYDDTSSSSDALDAMTSNSGVFSGVESQRAQVGADLVVLMRPYLGDGVCGVAWVGGYRTNGNLSVSRRYGYSHVSIDCSDLVLPHELGHNMGLSHSRRQSGEGGTYPWALGHGVDNRFATVMAYGSAFGTSRVPLFASPDLVCSGLPCGVDRNDLVNGADAVYTMHQVRGQVATYTQTVAPPAPAPPPPISPPVPGPTTRSVSLTAPAPGRLTPFTSLTFAWQTSSDIATVDLYYRIERKKKHGKWKKSSWRLLSDDDADGSFTWTVPNAGSKKKKKKKTRLRFLLRAHDGSGVELASEVTGSYKIPKKQ